MAKASHSRFDCNPGCAVEAAINLIDGKWKSILMFQLLSGTRRFNELRRLLPNCTPRMMTNQLRELEQDGLVIRTVYAQVPPKVEYSLSPLGRSMEPVLMALKHWGDANIGRYGKPHAVQTCSGDSRRDRPEDSGRTAA
ncbi:winged helix-turn-helix transcriptional regulator [Gemmobacter denitrificans]|uniref:Helix-turn-helix domain-containing protein n=1 Tax=Gemmobacter denitrificans TaxID=3123040 RepID=A0ABU8BT10_9RHOB